MYNAPSAQSKSLHPYSSLQLFSLVLLRLLIGWHFLYEGFAKVFNQNWTAAGFLLDSQWIFSGIFNYMAEDPTLIAIVNFSNIWGLIFIGLGLMTGTLTRISSLAGIFLLGLYYFATPPFIGYTYSVPMEGSYLIVNKNMIEAMALLVLILFPTGHIIGLDRLIFLKKRTS